LYSPPDFVQYDELLIKRLNNQAMESPRAVRYFEGRKITKESMAKFVLGYSEKQDSVTVPMYNQDGMCLGFVARTIEGKEFKNTPGLPKSKILFNLNRIKTSSTVYVVESSFDVIRLDQVGFPAVATLGANVSVSQIRLLEKYFNNVVLIADNDEAGVIMTDKLIEKLGSRVTVVHLDKKYKDIGDMDNDSIRKLEFQFDNSIASMLK
jgi:DNA primase